MLKSRIIFFQGFNDNKHLPMNIERKNNNNVVVNIVVS